jgi:hypothetical protein
VEVLTVGNGTQYGARTQLSEDAMSYQGPARTAHGSVYWLLVGWWWAPAKWIGRVALWVLFFPLGIWRSYANNRKKRDLRERRGYTA